MHRAALPIAAAAAAVLLAAVAAASSGISIADPSVCLSDAECPKTHHCKRDANRVQRCTPRLPNGARCRTTSECKENSFCFVDVVPRCRPQGKLNDVCNPVQGSACRRGLTCTPPSPDSCTPAPACDGNFGRCLPDAPGRAGAPCQFDRDCDQDGGFYCKTSATSDFVRSCARKKPDGADCDNRADNRECRGLCARGSFGLTRRKKQTGGVCAPASGLGQLCTEDLHCKRTFKSRADRDFVQCNRPRGSRPGRCALGSMLLRRLGAKCNPGFDMCDARRGLSCRWAPHLKRSACQQRFDAVDTVVTPYCTRGSRLSACPGPGQQFETECRATRVLPGTPFPTDFLDSYTRCERRRRVIPVGASCDVESDVCAKGSVCRVIPGLRLRDLGFRPRFGAQPAVYCVRLLNRGAKCGTASKFRAQCRDGLRCTAGKCVAGASDPSAPRPETTHANIDARCADLPCAPGFVCNKDKLCKRPVETVGLNALCDAGGVTGPKCGKPWLVCRTNWGPRGPRRCVTRRGVGAFCESDAWCKAGLECPRINYPGAGPRVRRCSQKLTKRLWRGQRCDLAGTTSDTRCATAAVPGRFGSQTFELTCLRPPRGPPKCQIRAEAFGLCGAANVQCVDRGFSCRGDVCVPGKA